MKTERLASHNEAREALVLSVAGVDGHYADCVFAFANSVLTAPLAQRKRATQIGWPS